MADTNILKSPILHWYSVLTRFVHRWEIRHGTLEEMGRNNLQIREQLGINDPHEIILRSAPNFVLRVEPEMVKVELVDDEDMEIRRWSAQSKAQKNHYVPRMLISRWAGKDGRVVWRRSEWKAGRTANMKPEKIMRASDFYTVNAGLDPQLPEGLLAILESEVVDLLYAIDEILDQPTESRTAELSNLLRENQSWLKIFVANQLIRTPNYRRWLEQVLPFAEFIKMNTGANEVMERELAVLRQNYEIWLKSRSSFIDPTTSFYKWAEGPESEIYVGFADSMDEVFPLTDDPVVMFPCTSSPDNDPLRPWWESRLVFLPICPRAGIGIKHANDSTNAIQFAEMSTGMLKLLCANLASRHSEVVLPHKRTWVWDVFNVHIPMLCEQDSYEYEHGFL